MYLRDKLDDFDEDVERHVSGHHAAGAFGEQRGDDGVEAAVDNQED